MLTEVVNRAGACFGQTICPLGVLAEVLIAPLAGVFAAFKKGRDSGRVFAEDRSAGRRTKLVKTLHRSGDPSGTGRSGRENTGRLG